ncbi:Crp/Fnr family transcriptional regulator [Chryseobacterium sp. T16E-39]|uniref:Crp/Fnr family transcriptional regulator n=1 Tax=Chryseobacterium sp. T16E-39 TaxID=2015076 RepID=UPI0012F7D495|nr:Crp/Fnr family transcriptional regulator [Chryseobacterium sp. T16E-39]
MKRNLIEYLRDYGEISEADAQMILAAFEPVTFKRGEWLSKAGTLSRKLYFMHEGILKITISDEGGDELVYFFMEGNQFMGFLYSMYGNVPTLQGLQAATDTELSVIDKESLFTLYKNLPYLKPLIDHIAYLSMTEMVNIRNNYLAGSAREKYQLLLKKQPEVALYVMQMDIASYLSITPESLSRIRSQHHKKE